MLVYQRVTSIDRETIVDHCLNRNSKPCVRGVFFFKAPCLELFFDLHRRWKLKLYGVLYSIS